MDGLVCPAGHAVVDAPADARFCSACGLPLTLVGEREEPESAGRRARRVSPQYGEGRLVKVGWAHNQAEAELLAGMLLDEGVPSVIKRALGVDVPDMLAAGPRDILVAASGADLARDILRPVDGRAPGESLRGTRPMWVRTLAGLLAGSLLLTVLVSVLLAVL